MLDECPAVPDGRGLPGTVATQKAERFAAEHVKGRSSMTGRLSKSILNPDTLIIGPAKPGPVVAGWPRTLLHWAGNELALRRSRVRLEPKGSPEKYLRTYGQLAVASVN